MKTSFRPRMQCAADLVEKSRTLTARRTSLWLRCSPPLSSSESLQSLGLSTPALEYAPLASAFAACPLAGTFIRRRDCISLLLKVFVRWLLPTRWSSKVATGTAAQESSHIIDSTTPVILATSSSCLGPVSSDIGKISPKISTQKMLSVMASQAGTRRSSTIGRHSFAAVFASSSVMSSRWWSLVTFMMRSARLLSTASSPTIFRRRLVRSIPMRPTVRPEASAARQRKPSAKAVRYQNSAVSVPGW
mmetsp:Transcript_54624/g.143850  ORF Transcript_54624/g.143850 Transcript_54624/m.143850 type:complete len:247 (+) Transcript_54624:258-998(+)